MQIIGDRRVADYTGKVGPKRSRRSPVELPKALFIHTKRILLGGIECRHQHDQDKEVSGDVPYHGLRLKQGELCEVAAEVPSISRCEPFGLNLSVDGDEEVGNQVLSWPPSDGTLWGLGGAHGGNTF